MIAADTKVIKSATPKYPEIVYSLPRGDQKYRLDYITKELVATGSSFWLMNSKRFDKFEKEICL